MGLRHFVQGTLTFFFRVCIVYIFKNIRFDVLQISCARKPYLFLKFGGSFFFGIQRAVYLAEFYGVDTTLRFILTKYSKCAGCFF